MLFRRLQVEEGFLDGLDLPLSPGLNVLIGPRGVGKTSIIELIRFCLDCPAFTDQATRRARQHAVAVLGGGKVTLTLQMDGKELLLSRAANQAKPLMSSRGTWDYPTILSQDEIESLGLEPRGRLRLLDGMRTGSRESDDKETNILTRIRSLTVEIRQLAENMERDRDRLIDATPIAEELVQAEQEETTLLQSLKSAQEGEELEQLSRSLAAEGVREEYFERSLSQIQRWKRDVEILISSGQNLETWPPAAVGPDPFREVRETIRSARENLSRSASDLGAAVELVQMLRSANEASRLIHEERARSLRHLLDEQHQGAGAISRRVTQLREQMAQAEALSTSLIERQNRLKGLAEERRVHLDLLDELREERFRERDTVAKKLSDDLAPRIRIKVRRFGFTPDYIAALATALRGSGLHYNVLAPQLAEQLHPRELVEASERSDVEQLGLLTGLSPDRVSRLIAALRDQGTEDILTAPLEDDIELRLLDGRDYKATDAMSTGQRCTVILPVLLSQRTPALVVDQPEDHLDNAFIVDTLITAIRQKKHDRQILFSTHNANIPVIGEAENVVVLGSDGRRGFVRYQGPLDDPIIVESITSVMEGGRDAFEQRAAFYGRPSRKNG